MHCLLLCWCTTFPWCAIYVNSQFPASPEVLSNSSLRCNLNLVLSVWHVWYKYGSPANLAMVVGIEQWLRPHPLFKYQHAVLYPGQLGLLPREKLVFVLGFFKLLLGSSWIACLRRLRLCYIDSNVAISALAEILNYVCIIKKPPHNLTTNMYSTWPCLMSALSDAILVHTRAKVLACTYFLSIRIFPHHYTH